MAGKSYAVRLEYYDNASTASVSLRYLFENVTDRERRIAAADAVIYCAGFDSDTERENHDRTFALPEGQAAEIAAVAKLNANLVVVVNSGGGVDFAQFADRARAILMAWYPGQEGGRAVAEILTGAVSPSGKLPISNGAPRTIPATAAITRTSTVRTARGHRSRASTTTKASSWVTVGTTARRLNRSMPSVTAFPIPLSPIRG